MKNVVISTTIARVEATLQIETEDTKPTDSTDETPTTAIDTGETRT